MGYIYNLKSNGEIVYIGKSSSMANLFCRLSSHEKCPDKKFDSFDYIEVDDSILDSEESRLIYEKKPIYNKIYTANDEYMTKTDLMKMVGESVNLIFEASELFGDGVVRDVCRKIKVKHAMKFSKEFEAFCESFNKSNFK